MTEIFNENYYNSTQALSIEADLFTENFEIYLFDEINSQSMKVFHMNLLKLNRLDANREITIYINSPGGEIYSGLVGYDLMKQISNPIKTVCTGLAASMGSILFAAGDKRVIYEHSQIMIHDPLIQKVGGSALSLQETVDSLMKTRDIIATLLAKSCGKTKDEILEKTKQDTYFNAQEAIEFGLAHEIMGGTL